jgi:hypothetical protein
MNKQCAQHLGDLFTDHDAREERRAERAREKAERKQRRDEALRAQPSAHDDGEAEAEPLANGESNDLRDHEPSTTVEFADEYLAMVKDWLRGRSGPASGDARN